MRIRDLMDYAFEVCFHYGKVVLSEDRNACALVFFPIKRAEFLVGVAGFTEDRFKLNGLDVRD